MLWIAVSDIERSFLGTFPLGFPPRKLGHLETPGFKVKVGQSPHFDQTGLGEPDGGLPGDRGGPRGGAGALPLPPVAFRCFDSG